MRVAEALSRAHPIGGANRLFRKASGLCYFAGLGAQSHATSIGCPANRSLSHIKDIFMHVRGHPTIIRYFEIFSTPGLETWVMIFTTVPFGSTTKKRRTPH